MMVLRATRYTAIGLRGGNTETTLACGSDPVTPFMCSIAQGTVTEVIAIRRWIGAQGCEGNAVEP
jgi:hypothetical protein